MSHSSPGRAVALLIAVLAAALPARSSPGQALDPEPIRVEALGLTMRTPPDAMAQVRQSGEEVLLDLVEGTASRRWSMRVQALVPSQADSTPKKQIEELLRRWSERDIAYREVVNEPVTIHGVDGHRCYVDVTMPNGERVVSGWLILAPDRWRYITVALQVVPDAFAEVRPTLDASLASIRLQAPGEIDDERKVRLDAGRAFLDALSSNLLGKLVGRSAWYRYYMPATSTEDGIALDLGYLNIEFTEDARGAVNANRDPENYDPSERERGLLVRVLGHYVDATSGGTYDSEARYWLSWDRQRETWSVLATERFAGKTRTEAQTGISVAPTTDNPRGLITVIKSERDGATRDQADWGMPAVYLPQALRWGLGALFPREGHEPHEYCFYSVEPTPEKPVLSLRTERWERDARRTGFWRLTSRARADGPEVDSVYGPDGMLVRRTFSTGAVSERIGVEELRRIWKNRPAPAGPGMRRP